MTDETTISDLNAMIESENGDLLDDKGLMESLLDTLSRLREMKPNDRSNRDRGYAVTITELEKVIAYFNTWVTGNGEELP